MEFSQISLLLGLASIFGILARRFKQPILVGYLFAGLAAAYFGLIGESEIIKNLGKIGVALLLFLVGVEMNIREIPTIGKAALYTGLGQMLFTFVIALSAGLLFGFGLLPSIYIAIAMSFSSTIIIVKLLSEKKDLDTLYGKVAVGFLLVQDLVAVLILMFLAGMGSGGVTIAGYIFIAIKGALLIIAVWALSKKVLPYLFERYVAESVELLFIVSIAWALGVAALVAGPLGLSLEIGGFMAGLALSNLPEHLEIASRTRPLRDFFLTLFFLTLGASLLVEGIGSIIFPALVFSLLVLIGNPIIVMIVMGFLRFKKRTSFLSSVTVAQISEFSLIVMAAGLALNHVSQSHVALTVIVAAITMTISTYIILGADKIYLRLKDKLSIFEREIFTEPQVLAKDTYSDHIILIGCGRTGKRLLSLFSRKKVPYIIVDYNPDLYTQMIAEKKPIVFGDISDPEILEAVSVERARMIISTSADFTDNLALLDYLKKQRRKPTTVFEAPTREEAIKLYESGANYVVLPEVLAGEHLRHILSSHGTDGKWFEKVGKGHFNRLLMK